MNQQEIIEFNRKCAEFIGAKPQQFGASKEYELYGFIESIEDGGDEKHFFATEEMKFHSDWNWIMEVVDKIEELGFITNSWSFPKDDNLHEFNIFDSECGHIEAAGKCRKEAVVQAINQFLTRHNANK